MYFLSSASETLFSLFFFPNLTVRCHVGCLCQVPPQRCGRGNILGSDCALGQQKQQEDAGAEDSPVSSSTYGTECFSRPLLPVQLKSEFEKLFCVVLKHPVYCVNVVGTQNANNLISISTDGKMCSWSLDMLSQPQVINQFIPRVSLYNLNNNNAVIIVSGGERLCLCRLALS